MIIFRYIDEKFLCGLYKRSKAKRLNVNYKVANKMLFKCEYISFDLMIIYLFFLGGGFSPL